MEPGSAGVIDVRLTLEHLRGRFVNYTAQNELTRSAAETRGK